MLLPTRVMELETRAKHNRFVTAGNKLDLLARAMWTKYMATLRPLVVNQEAAVLEDQGSEAWTVENKNSPGSLCSSSAIICDCSRI